MKKSLFISALLMLVAVVVSSFTVPTDEAAAPQGNPLIITTDANGEIESVKDVNYGEGCWHIRDLSGYTNIRNAPRGKVCMRLKAHTQYAIYDYTETGGNGWIQVSSIYNMRERYWVRLHSSSTGEYWMATSILYFSN